MLCGKTIHPYLTCHIQTLFLSLSSCSCYVNLPMHVQLIHPTTSHYILFWCKYCSYTPKYNPIVHCILSPGCFYFLSRYLTHRTRSKTARYAPFPVAQYLISIVYTQVWLHAPVYKYITQLRRACTFCNRCPSCFQ